MHFLKLRKLKTDIVFLCLVFFEILPEPGQKPLLLTVVGESLGISLEQNAVGSYRVEHLELESLRAQQHIAVLGMDVDEPGCQQPEYRSVDRSVVDKSP